MIDPEIIEFRLQPGLECSCCRENGAAPDNLDSTTQTNVRYVNTLLAERIDISRRHRYHPAKESISKKLTFNSAIILEACGNFAEAPKLLYKPLGPVEAARTEFVSLLANLFGIQTPLALRTQVVVAGHYVGSGVSSKYIERATCALEFRFEDASQAAICYAVRTRWFNELIGNLECWWGQFLQVPSEAGSTELIMVDLDGAFCSISPSFLQNAMQTHYDRPGISLQKCMWLDREYNFADPIAWSPKQYDSEFSFYGPLWRDYVEGMLEIDFDRINQEIESTQKISDELIRWTMHPFLATSQAYYKNSWVMIPAASNPKMDASSFAIQFLARWRRSTSEFQRFLAVLEKARRSKSSPLHAFYRNLANRGY
jgi:hypothetical protein